ncbi:MOSC domain-containing protein [Larsenimonas rhizosphaerae]|uniref:MOSC N-terminal beta barrel domain-containing protein n=1 Tax=Larsenimonas rhizosphaerae TaxID=2944682 RepID=A0AA42CUQ8_9GAMM|nr:MOSC N-terminal beta barrel domain-containing protein [Larsenimonas rhizosphaerae]MCX2524644.1 MOSC N-terminal beta barrel domain-containing protein [Larsenimonas rhizosphaerae]
MASVTGLYIYPVKSMAAIALSEATLTPEGLAMDRRWMVATDDGRFLTQRVCPAMARLQVALTDSHLIIRGDSGEALQVPIDQTGPRAPVTVFSETLEGIDQGDAASEWLTHQLGPHKGLPLRLYRVPEDNARHVDPDWLQDDEEVMTGFADGFPFLVALESSLDALNQTLGEAQVPMNRFRPNIVIAGSDLSAWQEHACAMISSTGWQLRLCKPCQRCKVTTVDQQTGTPTGKEPLKSLAAMKHVATPGAYFGENAVLIRGDKATIAVGDSIELDDARQ